MNRVTADIELRIDKRCKADYRRHLTYAFLEEECGSSSHTTYYRYFVDQLNDGNKIYLKRPTQLNKGVDFEVRVENTHFRFGVHGNTIETGNRPSHPDILNDLKAKKAESEAKYSKLLELITRAYRCESIDDKELIELQFESGRSVELIVKVLKWLFIEQDITYWNKSGREMLYNAILNNR